MWLKEVLVPLYRFLFLPKIAGSINEINIKKNMYNGERCFIVGTAPSINNMDLTLLKDEYTFIVNRGFLLEEQGLLDPTFYGIADKYAYQNYGDNIDSTRYRHCFVVGDVPWKHNCSNVSFLNMYTRNTLFKKMQKGFFQKEISNPLSYSSTVVLHMLQVAVWLGFKEVHFIGVDNNFSQANMHFYKDTQGEKDNMKSFKDPTYANSIAFEKAYKLLKKDGIHIYNSGVGGSLDSIPRKDYYSLFEVKE